jgi:hypothetical protein
MKPDPWAKKWLDARREAGEKCLSVEKREDGHHYVRKSTTRWDAGEKKVKKVSGEYLGRLQPDGTLIKRPARKRCAVRTVKVRGTALLLRKASEGILDPLRGAFPNAWKELVALAWTRLAYTGTLKRAGEEWNRLDDVMGLGASVGKDALSDALHEAGADRAAMVRFFAALPPGGGRLVAADLSVCFSRAKGACLVKKGYNRFRLDYPQFKIVLLCDPVSGKPLDMRMIGGNERECAILDTVREQKLGGATLVLDRGFFSGSLMDSLSEAGIDYVVPARRNSALYGEVPLTDAHFAWRGRAIRCGKARSGDAWLYRFEDLSMRSDELAGLMSDAGKGEFAGSRAGNIVMRSSLDAEPEAVYGMYKQRESVEKCFDAGKNALSADRTFMRDDDGVRGHLLVTFLAMRIRSEISCWLKDAGLSSKRSPEDVVFAYSSVYSVRSPDMDLEYQVPPDVRKLDSQLGINLFSD